MLIATCFYEHVKMFRGHMGMGTAVTQSFPKRNVISSNLNMNRKHDITIAFKYGTTMWYYILLGYCTPTVKHLLLLGVTRVIVFQRNNISRNILIATFFMNLLKHLMGLGTVNQSFPIRGVILRSLYMILKME